MKTALIILSLLLGQMAAANVYSVSLKECQKGSSLICARVYEDQTLRQNWNQKEMAVIIKNQAQLNQLKVILATQKSQRSFYSLRVVGRVMASTAHNHTTFVHELEIDEILSPLE